MPDSAAITQLKAWLEVLSQLIPDQQWRVDEDTLARRAEFVEFYTWAQEHNYKALAQAVAPLGWALKEVEITTQLRLEAHRETEFGFAIQPINLGFVRRYGQAQWAQIRLNMKIQSRPGLPAQAELGKENSDG